MESSTDGSSTTIIVRKERSAIRIENPFTLKVGQVFTGFGIGCGLGIGVGRPLNLGAIPVFNEVMSATRGATDAFSGVGRHVNTSLRKLGAKNVEAGIGCGVGFGHGFGVGLAIKPGVLHQIQFRLVEFVTNTMMRFGMAPNLSASKDILQGSVRSGMSSINNASIQNPIGGIMGLATNTSAETFQNMPKDETSASTVPELNAPYASRTEKILSNFLQNPILTDEGREPNEQTRRVQSENTILQMVLKHQQIIGELVEENEKLRRILVEDLKIPAGKLDEGGGTYSIRSNPSCSDCFECRRKQRRR